MYKKQVKLQRLLCIALLIVSAMIFVYSLGIMTDLYDALYTTIRNPEKLEKTSVTGSRIYYDMQGFNRQFVLASIGMILLCVTLFLTGVPLIVYLILWAVVKPQPTGGVIDV